MKKLKLFIGILIGFMILSCSSDDDNGNQQPTVAGELIVNGQTYNLTKGFIIPNYTGSDPNYDPRRFYFILTNGDVTLENNDFVYSFSDYRTFFENLPRITQISQINPIFLSV